MRREARGFGTISTFQPVQQKKALKDKSKKALKDKGSFPVHHTTQANFSRQISPKEDHVNAGRIGRINRTGAL